MEGQFCDGKRHIYIAYNGEDERSRHNTEWTYKQNRNDKNRSKKTHSGEKAKYFITEGHIRCKRAKVKDQLRSEK